MNQKENHSNNPLSKQPTDAMGRYQEKPQQKPMPNPHKPVSTQNAQKPIKKQYAKPQLAARRIEENEAMRLFGLNGQAPKKSEDELIDDVIDEMIRRGLLS